jgi:cell division protein FtsW (lipid II flippase)
VLLLEHYEKKDEYLEELKNQIRNKKAKQLVAEEIEQHIEDQKDSYVAAGDDENIAMKKAIIQMGNPVDVGIQLNKIHKPRLEYNLVIIVLTLCAFSILTLLNLNDASIKLGFSNGIDLKKHILLILVGLLFMVIVYFLDYSILGKYPKLIWMLLLVGFIVYSPFGYHNLINGSMPFLYAYGMLLYPAFGGIIYAYRKCGYVGILKCLMFGISGWIMLHHYVAQSSVYLGLFLCMLIMLTIAVLKNWFGTTKVKGLLFIWGWVVGTIIVFFMNIKLISAYQWMRLQETFHLILHPEQFAKGYQMDVTREALINAKWIGGSTEFTLGYIPSLNNDYILTYIICTFGILAGIFIIMLFLLFVGHMFYISLKQKNALGMFIGIGCCFVFTVQGFIYILANLSIQLISQVNLPFVSYGGTNLLVNFIILGLLLSIFRNTCILKEIPYKKKFNIKIEKVK